MNLEIGLKADLSASGERMDYMRIFAKDMFIHIMREAKDNRKWTAIEYIEKLRGAAMYANIKGDISNETCKRLMKLTWLIKKKYNLW